MLLLAWTVLSVQKHNSVFFCCLWFFISLCPLPPTLKEKRETEKREELTIWLSVLCKSWPSQRYQRELRVDCVRVYVCVCCRRGRRTNHHTARRCYGRYCVTTLPTHTHTRPPPPSHTSPPPPPPPLGALHQLTLHISSSTPAVTAALHVMFTYTYTHTHTSSQVHCLPRVSVRAEGEKYFVSYLRFTGKSGV